MQETYFINKTATSVAIYLYGYIGSWGEVDTNKFINEFNNLQNENYSQIDIFINSCGGSVFDGISLYETIRQSTIPVHTNIIGVAASIASVIALAGDTVRMSKNAKLMIHRVTSNANGDADKLRETANLMEELENSLMQIYSDKTGKSIESIQTDWMQSGKDIWFNATEALKANLIDEIVDSPVKKNPPKSQNDKQLWAFYNSYIQNTNQTLSNSNITMNIPNSIISFYNLSENASEHEILAAMQNQANLNKDLQSEIENLKAANEKFLAQFEEENKNKITELINAAIRDKRITEEQRSTYTTLAEANYSATKSAISQIKPYQSITSQIQPTSTGNNEMTFQEYRIKNPKALLEMKKNDFEKFSDLYQAEYGKKPVNN